MTGSGQIDEAQFRSALQHFEKGNFIEFDRLCAPLLASQPNHPDLSHMYALSCRAQGKLQDAQNILEHALSQSLEHPAILNSYGLILLEQGDANKAIKVLTRALIADPNSAAAHANMGHAQRALSLFREAEESYREALRVDPNCADALIQLALLLRKENRLADLGYSLSPTTGQFHSDPGLAMVQGFVALDQDLPAQAEASFHHALSRLPGSAILWNNLGLSLSKQGKECEALKAYEKAINLEPSLFEARSNIADLLKYDSPKVARKYLLDAIRIQPNNENAHDLLGFTWFMDREHDRAIDSFTHALTLNSNFEQAAAHRAGAYFLKGDLSSAWLDYNRKYGSSGLCGSPASDSLPLWNSETPLKEPIIIWTDQGLGDEVLQLGFISDIQSELQNLTIATSDRLVPVASRSFPDAKCISLQSVQKNNVAYPPSTVQSPAMQVASLTWKSFKNCPERRPYLVANETEVTKLRKKYRGHKQKNILVGISWKSSNAKFGSNKSLNLSDLEPLLAHPGITFVNLQYGDTEEELGALPSKIQNNIISDYDIDSLVDIESFTNQVGALDLVITTSNTTAHIAGALGCRTWTLVPCVGRGWLWYWFDERSDSPWYPKMRLFRQTNIDGWSSPLNKVQAQLSVFIKEFQSVTGN